MLPLPDAPFLQRLFHEHFTLTHCVITDQSEAHQGHAEAQRHGGGHWSILIVSPDFEGRSLLKRHRQVMRLLQPYWKKDIHALALKTLTPQEWAEYKK